MAFNLQTFRTRTLTALIFGAVMLAGLFWNQWSFLILFSIVHFGCWWEYLNLQEKIQQTAYPVYTRLGFMLTGFGLLLLFCSEAFTIAGYNISQNFSLTFSAAGFILLIMGLFHQDKVTVRSFGAAALGWLYISLTMGLMIWLYREIDIHLHDTMFVLAGNTIPVLIILSLWVNDTMAYIVGSFIGKTPLSKISPKKTWEGTLGGILLSVLVVSLLLPLAFLGEINKAAVLVFGAIALIAAVAGTMGDLLESKLKRMAGVKDSGTIMPGHGGFLDRFDSLLLAVPFVWIFIILLLQNLMPERYLSPAG